MIKFENTEVAGWEHAIRGMRNPMNSWKKGDSFFVRDIFCDNPSEMELADFCGGIAPLIGENDLDLMRRLRNAGTDHRKFMRMIIVYADITAPLYWWKEFDTYKVGTVVNSCSTMHKIEDKEFTLEDFSCEHLINIYNDDPCDALFLDGTNIRVDGDDLLGLTINVLNYYRTRYIKTKDKKYWWQMIQLLPSSYNQKRTVMMNYEVLANIYKSRRNHKLDEWSEHPVTITKLDIQSVGLTKDGLGVRGPIETKQEYFGFCDWIKTLPYCELITGEEENNDDTKR